MSDVLVPQAVNSRSQAAQLVAGLPDDLSSAEVIVDVSSTELMTPSFVDELVRQCLQVRNARAMRLKDADEMFIDMALESARLRDVATRLFVE